MLSFSRRITLEFLSVSAISLNVTLDLLRDLIMSQLLGRPLNEMSGQLVRHIVRDVIGHVDERCDYIIFLHPEWRIHQDILHFRIWIQLGNEKLNSFCSCSNQLL